MFSEALFDSCMKILKCTIFTYWNGLFAFIYLRKDYSSSEISAIFGDDKWARVQIYSLSIIFTKLWSKKHYRSASFKQDMIDNLQNVAIPGTGIPLSVFCYSYYVCLLFIIFANPLICFFAAVNKARKEKSSLRKLIATKESRDAFVSKIAVDYIDHLLHPDDWFSYWRLNCRLVSLHSLLTKSNHYDMEDKWTFLTKGKELNVPVSPFIDDIDHLVCKNKNIEGGMGIFFYHNASHGGDWILQKRLTNSAWLNKLLPHNAPLSTMRVITSSSYTLPEHPELRKAHSSATALTERFVAGAGMSDTAIADDGDTPLIVPEAKTVIRAESAVLRLGRSNAVTDHSSVLFDVDISTGIIKEGVTNAHWYELGPGKAYTCPWLPPSSVVTSHPDEPKPKVTGNCVQDMEKALAIVINSHFSMMRDVPLVGWDVTFCPDGIFLLEVNLSCNFFKGTFDKPQYIEFVDSHWCTLEKLEKNEASASSSINEADKKDQ